MHAHDMDVDKTVHSTIRQVLDESNLEGNLYSGLKNSNPGLRWTLTNISCREEASGSVSGEAGGDDFFGDFFLEGFVFDFDAGVFLG